MTDLNPDKITPSLLFLGGFPSGGTDLLKNIINAHSDIMISGEFPFMHRIPSELDRLRSSGDPAPNMKKFLREIDVYQHIPDERLEMLNVDISTTASDVATHIFKSGDAAFVGSKTPQFTEHADTLLSRFPDSRMIIIVRDPRDNALSWSKKWGRNPVAAAERWARRMKFAIKASQEYPDRVHILKYEALLSDLEGELKKITRFLNLDFDSNMLEYHKHVGKVFDGKLNYGKPIIRENFEKWREELSPSVVKTIEEVTFDTMSHFSYTPHLAEKGRKLGSWERKAYMVKDSIGFITTGNRALPLHKRIFSLFNSVRIIAKRKLMKG